MSGERFYSLPASFPLEPHKTAPYYILTKEGVARADSRLTGAVASRGDIFQYDPDSDGTLHEINKPDKKKKNSRPGKIIMRAIHSKKVKVEWDSASFAPLTNEEKELLEAIESTKCRFMTYSDPKEFLSFGCQLKKGEMVQVCSSALSKSKDDVHGVLMHKGPMVPSKGFEPKGTWFGVILSIRCGKHSGRYKGHTYFDCDDDSAVFVSIDKLVPVRIPRKAEGSHRQAKDVSSRNCASAKLGIDGAANPPFIRKGMKVEVKTVLKTGKQWIEGEVVDTKSKDGETYVAVEVAKHHGLAINTHGTYRGIAIFSSNMSAYTVTAQLSDVRLLESTQRDRHKNEEKSATERAISNPKDDIWHKKETHVEQQAVHDRETGALPPTTRVNIKYPTKEVEKPVHTSGRETATQTPIQGILSSTQQQMQNDLNKNSPTSPVITRPPSAQEMDFHDDYYHVESNTEHPPATQPGRKQEEQKKKTHTEQAKGLFSSIAASLSFKGVEQPSFPLDDWYLGQITIGGNDLLRNLAYDLRIKDADEIFRRGKDIFGVTSWLLKQWWEQLNEGHKAAFQELKDSLKKNGFGELVYYLENGDPTDGCFHSSIIQIVEYKFGSRLPQLADKLGVSVTAENLPLSVFAEQVFDVWQNRHQGIEKLSQLVHVIKEISKEIAKTEKKEQESPRKAAELKDLALELEQGLSESVIRSISSSVPKKEWYQLGYSLGLSQLRLNAMEKKFFSLSNRVFHVLRYWQMIQPYEVDQAEKLIVALQSCGLQENVHIISKGLDEERLMRVAECIGDNWKIFAGIVFSPRGIQHLMDSTARDQDKALSALRKWKRKQPATCKDLKKKLYEDLKDYKLVKAAKMVFDGLDTDTLYTLGRKVVFDWQPLAQILDLTSYDIRRFDNLCNPVQSSYQMLATWNTTNDRDLARKRKLCDALRQIGLEDVAEWLKNADEDNAHDDFDKHQGNTTQITSATQEPEIKPINKVLLTEIATKLKNCDADALILKEFLELSSDDITKYAPTNVTRSTDPHLFNLLAWRRKMRSLNKGTKEIASFLQKALIKCGLEDAANFISAGTPVDLQGAVGRLPASQLEVSKENLYVNSLVEFIWKDTTYHGTIQWIGDLPDFSDHGRIAGIETEEYLANGGNYESFRGRKYFECDHGRGIFLPLTRCQPDSRFPTESQTLNEYTKTSKEDFGGIDCDPIPGYEEPRKSVSEDLVGQFKGIQGDHNSCYMDVTLYSMFAYSDIFDKILGWSKESKDDGVQFIKDHLRESIVNPLRSKGVVRADYILQFREMLNELSSMKGLRTEEKDPEEFIHTLLQELLSAKPFLKISQGDAATMESFVYQIFLEKSDYLEVPTVEQLVHLSFLESDLKLSEVPKCFIVQLPRFGKQFKLYDWIIPSLEMDITSIVKNSTRQCTVCGKLAFSECKDCRPKRKSDEDIIQSFCGGCWKQKHEKLSHHTPVTLLCQGEFVKKYRDLTNNETDPTAAQDMYDSHKMELFSVMCIETSHYVAFVKTGSGQDSQWVFFDSMADRIGDHRGYNVPEVAHIPSFESTVTSPNLIEELKKPNFPSYMKRLFGDAYICFYRLVSAPQSPSHGSELQGHLQRNLGEASQGSLQKAYYREESHQSFSSPSDMSKSDLLKTEDLISRTVRNPPSTGYEGRYEAQHGENTTSRGELEAMDCETTDDASEICRPNILARSRRREFSNASGGVDVNRGHQNSNTYTSTYNYTPSPPSAGNEGLHDTSNINSAYRERSEPNTYGNGREDWQCKF